MCQFALRTASQATFSCARARPRQRRDELEAEAGWRSVDHGFGERGPGRSRDAVLAERLQADVIGARVEVRAHDFGDLLRAALRDDCVDEPVGAAVAEVVLGEAEMQ